MQRRRRGGKSQAAARDAEPRDETHPADEPATGTRLSQAEIHANVLDAAEEELRRPAPELAWSGLDAGLTIGFSFLAAALVGSLVPDRLHAVGVAAAYPLGFVFVVLSRSQLFTENTLEPVVPLLARWDRTTLAQVLRLWAIVLPANLAGGLLFGLAAAWTPMLPDTLHPALLRVAEDATGGGFVLVFYKAIFGGWLVALMAWLVSSTRSTGAQIALVWMTTAPIAAFGFRHCVAGSVEAVYLAAVGGAGWGAMLAAFVVPAVLGNVVGGVTLVAILNHRQVTTPRTFRRGWSGGYGPRRAPSSAAKR